MKDNGTATNRDGDGSTYAGTQSPNNDAPDAYQKPKEEVPSDNKEEPKGDLGAEYKSDDSYGKKGNDSLEEGSPTGE